MSCPVLQVSHLRKLYPGKNKRAAVDGVSFELYPGEILGFLGPNGSGKTTTIQMLLGTLASTSGSIFYFGKDFAKHRSSLLEKVSFASTYTSLPWILTVGENLKVLSRLYNLPIKVSRAHFLPLLERFGLAEHEHSRVSSLSAGQVTRLMLIKAFFINPSVVLLDEPTASLDPDMAGEICSFILEQRKAKGLSILFTSHKMEEVTRLCDRVIFLKEGKIIANDIPKNLTQSVSSFRVKLLLVDGMKRTLALASLHNLPYKIDHRTITLTISDTLIPVFLNELGKADVTYSNIQIEEPSLEDFFLHVARGAHP